MNELAENQLAINPKPNSADRLKPYCWKPGQSGNPKGRPKGALISDVYRRLLEEKVPGDPEGRRFVDFAAKKILNEILRKDGKLIEAMKEITDRVDGKPSQKVEISGSLDSHVMFENYDFDKLSIEELRTVACLLDKAKMEAGSNGNGHAFGSAEVAEAALRI